MSRTYRVGEDVAWTSGAARVVALDLVDPTATPYALEGSAAAVWTEIAEEPGIATGELLRRLSEAFDIDQAEIRGDVERVLDELVGRNLLIPGEAGD